VRDEAGFALIEVVVSAMIALLVTGGVVSVLNASGRLGSEERHRAQAFSLAQEDQARLRGIQISSLNSAMSTQEKTLNGTRYKIESNATFISDKTSTTNCTGTNVSADYVRIGSTVTWTGMRATPVVLESIVSPVSGSLNPTNGSIAFTITDAANRGISGVGLTGSGPGTFNGFTDSNGCALFGGLAAGDYSVTPAIDPEYVTTQGESPEIPDVRVTAGNVTPVPLQWDRAGTVNLNFQVKSPSGSNYQPSSENSVTATATGLQGGRKAFWTPGKALQGTVQATPLYPFTYPYGFYAGSCQKNEPTSGGASVTVTRGSEQTAMITVPGLYLKVANSSGTALNQAKVAITDNECPGAPKRTYLTNVNGALEDPGLPSSASYKVCASAVISGSTKALTVNKEVRSLTGTSLEMKLTTNGSACW
jgi:type II secretory pathway pseudopilin PulG